MGLSLSLSFLQSDPYTFNSSQVDERTGVCLLFLRSEEKPKSHPLAHQLVNRRKESFLRFLGPFLPLLLPTPFTSCHTKFVGNLLEGLVFPLLGRIIMKLCLAEKTKGNNN